MISDENLRRARVLIVDDEAANTLLLSRILERAGYDAVLDTTDPREVLPLFREWKPDLLLLDLHMPHLSGFEILEALRAEPGMKGYLPVLVLTGDESEEVRQRALSSGARDFLLKPFAVSETLLRIRNLLEARFLYRELEAQNEQLAERVHERTRALETTQHEMLARLAQAAEFRDDSTGQHTRRVGELAARIAAELGLERDEVELIRRAAPLHDVGKVAIPDAILMKPGDLTPEEFEVMKTHTTVGAKILAEGSSELMARAEEIAIGHHENWEGGGYPHGARGDEIPLPARIVAVADVFDALSHARVYRPAWPRAEVVDHIERGRGRKFDPEVVDAFRSVEGRAGGG